MPYRLDPDTLRRIANRTEHALGDAQREEADRVPAIANWNPDFAFTHVHHYILESLGEAFTYQTFRSFAATDATAKAMLWDPAQAMIEQVSRTVGSKLAHTAMRWRIGNSYYSFLRELVVLAELRCRGVELETHPLADALFRVDAWSGQAAVSLYVGNRRYRDGAVGRKKRTDVLLGDSFRYVSIKLPTPDVFGRVKVPTPAALDDAARSIRAALGS